MACNEIDVMRRQVCANLHGKVEAWKWELQARYGDPRVYAMQQQMMNRQEAAVAHDMDRRNTVNETYEQNRTKQRTAHSKRIKNARVRVRARDKPPESAAGPSRTPPPADAPPPGN